VVGGVYLNLFIAQPHWVSMQYTKHFALWISARLFFIWHLYQIELLLQTKSLLWSFVTINRYQQLFNILGIKKTERIPVGSHGQIRCIAAIFFTGCKFFEDLLEFLFCSYQAKGFSCISSKCSNEIFSCQGQLLETFTQAVVSIFTVQPALADQVSGPRYL
jgi:hypothetical protein